MSGDFEDSICSQLDPDCIPDSDVCYEDGLYESDGRNETERQTQAFINELVSSPAFTQLSASLQEQAHQLLVTLINKSIPTITMASSADLDTNPPNTIATH